MCVSPVSVPNPYYCDTPFHYFEGGIQPLDSCFVSNRAKIDVPCGNCPDCLNSRYAAILQRVQMEARTSWCFMVTLTYDDNHLPYLSFRTNTGELLNLYYSDISHIQLLMKRLRDRPIFADRGLRYFAVTEYGSEKFRPHHHLMLFVARKKSDTYDTALSLERYLYVTIKSLYALNVGTRKHPIYEPLFRFVKLWKNGRYHSNFDCRLIRDLRKSDDEHFQKETINTPESVGATVSYVLSYINKPSPFEDTLLNSLEHLRESLDHLTFTRLTRILKGRMYYSKHLGFGFDDSGVRVAPSPRSICCTRRTVEINELLSQLPDTWQEFESSYPDMAAQVSSFYEFHLSSDIHCNRFYQSSLSSYLEHLSYADYRSFLILAKYDKSCIFAFMRKAHITSLDVSIRYLPKSYDDSYKSSVVYREIRRYIEHGIRNKQPFLAFEYVDDDCVKYVPLCKYFRRYCSDFTDVKRMYDSLGVSCFDEYCALFEPNEQLTEKRLRTQQTNKDRHDSAHISQQNDVENTVFSRLQVLKSKYLTIFAPTYDTICRLNC